MSVCRFMYPFTARPLGSFMFLKAVSQARASAVEQATLGTLGTLRAALFTGKMLFEDGTVEVFFFVLRRVDREAPGGIRHFSVADGLGGHLFQRVDPAVADAVGELFLLPPGYFRGEHIGESSRRIFFSITLPGHILASGLRRMAISRNSLSRKGTRPSTPQAHKLLLARRQSYI